MLNASSAARSASPSGTARIDLVSSSPQVSKVRVEVSPGDCVLGGVVPKHGAASDARGLCDVVDAHLVEATGGEQPQGNVGDVLRRGGTAPADPRLLELFATSFYAASSFLALDAIF